MEDQDYAYLKTTIQRLLDIDLSSYKSQQMRRRLEGFIARTSPGGVAVFCKLLDRDPGVLQKLKAFITINVSEFFRDASQFNLMRTQVLPQLLSRSPALNIWSAGCSIGAEAYSLAIVLEELAPGKGHRILATDLDTQILSKAKVGGPYSKSEVANVEKLRLLKHFVPVEKGYMIADGVKRVVEFRQQNLLTDKFEHSFDLILCRNVMIYFSDEAKSKLHQGFCASLKEEGILFLGGTEGLTDAKGLGLTRLHSSIYRKAAKDEPVKVGRNSDLVKV
jgi:chemotaxis protein methyltransferase CheR